MTKTPPDGIHPLRSPAGNVHLLVHGRRAVIVDTGLFSLEAGFRRLFARLGLAPQDVEAILLTHGHLDHTGNLAWLKSWTGAPVLAHAAEQAHVDGAWPYRGVTRVCGALEAAGRAVLRYRPVRIDRTIADGDDLPFWGGLRVVHLPGHTAGHCGFWSERHHLLLAGDLVAIWTWRTTLPPPIFNSVPHRLPDSLARAEELNPRFVVPAHYNRWDPAWMAERFLEFARRKRGADRSRRAV